MTVNKLPEATKVTGDQQGKQFKHGEYKKNTNCCLTLIYVPQLYIPSN